MEIKMVAEFLPYTRNEDSLSDQHHGNDLWPNVERALLRAKNERPKAKSRDYGNGRVPKNSKENEVSDGRINQK
jgi:hypothetical protein